MGARRECACGVSVGACSVCVFARANARVSKNSPLSNTMRPFAHDAHNHATLQCPGRCWAIGTPLANEPLEPQISGASSDVKLPTTKVGSDGGASMLVDFFAAKSALSFVIAASESSLVQSASTFRFVCASFSTSCHACGARRRKAGDSEPGRGPLACTGESHTLACTHCRIPLA